MPVLVLATLDEARPLLDLLKAEKRQDLPVPAYDYPATAARPGGLVVISGMGPENAARATEHAIVALGATTLVNPGICGTLTESLKPGDLCIATSVVDGDTLLDTGTASAITLPDSPAWRHLTRARLASCKNPVFGGEPRQTLAAHADIVDMEGQAIAQAARQQGLPCTLLKGVSDHANDTGRNDLHRNLATVSDSLARAVVDGLAHHDKPVSSLLRRLADFVKVEHTIFSLPLLFAGAWIGASHEWPGLKPLLLIALAGLGARTLGMAMNRILDRKLDSLNPRTRDRELPSGTLTPAQGWSVAASGLALFLLACAALGPVCLFLSPIPAMILVSYSLMKRFTPLCHFGIGVCLALGPVGAHVAVTGGLSVPPALLSLAYFTFFWISGSDILYALQDLESDKQTGVRSIPASAGATGARWIAAGIHGLALASAYSLWVATGRGAASGAALALTGAALAMMYWERLPLAFRFFPVSAIAGIAGALIALFGR